MNHGEIFDIEVSLSWAIYLAVLLTLIFVIVNYKFSCYNHNCEMNVDKKDTKTKFEGEAHNHLIPE